MENDNKKKTEEEKTKEAELQAKEAELQAKEAELQTKEAELQAKEEAEKQSLAETIGGIKTEYEEKYKKQDEYYTAKIKERDDVIKQLLTGEGKNADKKLTLVDRINAQREAQERF